MLFDAMAQRGGTVGFTAIEWFNGGLFADDSALPVDGEDIEQLLRAARRDWSQPAVPWQQEDDSRAGESYTRALRKAWPEVPGGVDLVCYWFAKAWAMIERDQISRVGLVSTNSIRSGKNRDVLVPVIELGRIFDVNRRPTGTPYRRVKGTPSSSSGGSMLGAPFALVAA